MDTHTGHHANLKRIAVRCRDQSVDDFDELLTRVRALLFFSDDHAVVRCQNPHENTQARNGDRKPHVGTPSTAHATATREWGRAPRLMSERGCDRTATRTQDPLPRSA